MKITNQLTGRIYALSPDTVIDMERANPFFNEYGEQSLPLSLPDTDGNREALGFADLTVNVKKPPQRIPITIQAGEFYAPGVQNILDTQRKEGITTSFYINEGAFYAQMSDVSVTDVFGDETIEGVSSIGQALAFCRSLLTVPDDRFSIFQVHISDGSSDTLKTLNRTDILTPEGYMPKPGETASLRFWNEFPRTEQVGDATIALSPGYYITPFIKANYLLDRVLKHFGYTLLDSYFASTYPFTDMVFLNNTMDAIVTGTIKLSQLVPDCTCADILEVFRRKFCCEFIPDELEKTVRIVFLKDILSSGEVVDITSALVGHPKISFPEQYRRLTIGSEDVYTFGDIGEFESVADVLRKYPSAFINPADSCFYRFGYGAGGNTRELVATSSVPYSDHDDDTYEEEKITVPDVSITFTTASLTKETTSADIDGSYRKETYLSRCLYIGPMRALNSLIRMSGSDDTSEDPETDTAELKPMLAFAYYEGSQCHGTVTNYSASGERLSDYSLAYVGSDGIFARFYADYDLLLRNSLHTVSADLLLTPSEKQKVLSYSKVFLSGAELLPDVFRYTLGGRAEPVTSDFFTVRLYEPVSHPHVSSYSPPFPLYKWTNHRTVTVVSKSEYELSPYKDVPVDDYYFPMPPTEQQYEAGGEYHIRYTCQDVGGNVYWLIKYFLAPVLFSYVPPPRDM